jgi:hypothetical protein
MVNKFKFFIPYQFWQTDMNNPDATATYFEGKEWERFSGYHCGALLQSNIQQTAHTIKYAELQS